MTESLQSHRTFVVGLSGGLGQSMYAEMIKHSIQVQGSYKNNPTAAATLSMDLSDSESILTTANKLKSQNARFDSLILNSGVSVLGPQLEVSNPDYDLAFRVNFFGPREVIRAFLPLLEKNAKILLIGSTSSWGALPLSGPYSLSKRLLREFWQILRQEFLLDPKTREMKLILIEPGAFKTGIWDHGQKSINQSAGKESFAARLIPRIKSQATDAPIFGERIVSILKKSNPCAYYRFGGMSFISRTSEWFPVGLRLVLIRILNKFGIQLYTPQSQTQSRTQPEK